MYRTLGGYFRPLRSDTKTTIRMAKQATKDLATASAEAQLTIDETKTADSDELARAMEELDQTAKAQGDTQS